MIQALILDIDGVILGHQEGNNFPLPSLAVQAYLQNLSKNDFPVSLCSVKATFAVEPIAVSCHLKSHHITDAGATLINIVSGEKLSFTMPEETVNKLSAELIRENVYLEWYTEDGSYFSHKNGNSIIRDARTNLFGGHSATLLDACPNGDLVKIIVLPETPFQRETLTKMAERYPDIELHWANNPSRIPADSGCFTLKTATKRTGAQRLATLTGIPLSETLAIGDSTNDWTFMELCGYVATLENGSSELKELIATRGNNGFTSTKSIDNDGLIDILRHFGI